MRDFLFFSLQFYLSQLYSFTCHFPQSVKQYREAFLCCFEISWYLSSFGSTSSQQIYNQLDFLVSFVQIPQLCSQLDAVKVQSFLFDGFRPIRCFMDLMSVLSGRLSQLVQMNTSQVCLGFIVFPIRILHLVLHVVLAAVSFILFSKLKRNTVIAFLHKSISTHLMMHGKPYIIILTPINSWIQKHNRGLSLF